MRLQIRRTDEAVQRRAKKRLARLPTIDILNWLDQAGSGMARSLGDYRRDPESTISLEEAHEGALAVLSGIELLLQRHG